MCDCNQWQMKLHVHNACSNHLFKMASMNVGSKESILLQQSGHYVPKCVVVDSTAQKFSLVAEEWEEVLTTDEVVAKAWACLLDDRLVPLVSLRL